tara:strand:- start:735 stop:1436 length:702 start_codon:yes stop_codon:yes gene_type:complete
MGRLSGPERIAARDERKRLKIEADKARIGETRVQGKGPRKKTQYYLGNGKWGTKADYSKYESTVVAETEDKALKHKLRGGLTETDLWIPRQVGDGGQIISEARQRTDAELDALRSERRSALISKYSGNPEDKVAQDMKIIQSLNLSGNNTQQTTNTNTSGDSTAQDQETPSLNKTTVIQGSDKIIDGMKISAEGQKWLEKTANSPAAKAGFSKADRWRLQLKHREWKANRNKK